MAEIYRGLATGADGSVYPVAIKLLLPTHTSDPDFIDMMIDEAKISRLLDHPNIARVYELGVVEETYFLVMEHVDGHDLRSLCRGCRARGVELPTEYAVYCVELALRGLHSAHELQDPEGRPLEVVHRDFSPSNILVSYDGRVKLIDFGIAKANLRRVKTRVGIIKGKVKYMSPEQTVGRKLDRRSDVFAAGVVLHEILTGRLPFEAPNDVAIMEAIRNAPPLPLRCSSPRISTELERILLRALSKARDQRFASAAAFADAIEVYRERHFPRFNADHLGAFVGRMFARERIEHARRYCQFDLKSEPGDDTLTGHRAHYTRLVEVADATSPTLPSDSDSQPALGEIPGELGQREAEPQTPGGKRSLAPDGPDRAVASEASTLTPSGTSAPSETAGGEEVDATDAVDTQEITGTWLRAGGEGARDAPLDSDDTDTDQRAR